MSSTSSPDSRPAEGARAPFPAELPAAAPGLPTIRGFTVTGTELEVCRDIERRQAHGLAKYGKTVADNPLTELQWLQHLYEELLDGAVYAKRFMPLLARLRAHSDMLSQIAGAVGHLCNQGDSTLAGVERALSDLAARDALIGELREGVTDIAERLALRVEDSPGSAMLRCEASQALNALLARLPKDAGAELERLRKEMEVGKAFHDLAVKERNAERLINDVLRADLATAERERAEAAEARVKELEAEVADARRTYMELVTDGNAVTLAQSLQRAEARVRELEQWNREASDELVRAGQTIGKSEARLAAVLVSVKRFTETHGKIRWGYDGDCGSNSLVETLELAIAIDAARAQAGKEGQLS